MPWRAEEGSAAAELAVLGPLFALLIAGLVEGSGMVQTVAVVRNAAREGARYAAVSDPNPAGKALAYLSSTFGSRTDVTLPSASSGCTGSNCISVSYAGTPTLGNSVTVTVPVTLTVSAPIIQNILGSSLPISASATMRIVSQ